jgi:phage shock protein C
MKNQLYRSEKNKVIAGVCGGIAEHLDVDPVLVRLVYILLTFGTGLGPGLIVYVIAWMIIPAQATAPTKPVTPPPAANDSSAV